MVDFENIQLEPRPDGIEKVRELLKNKRSVESVSFESLQETVPLFLDDLKAYCRNWFSQEISYRDEHIAEEIFLVDIRTSIIKKHYKYCFAALIASVTRTWNRASEYHSAENETLFRGELHLLSEMASKTLPFLRTCIETFEGRTVDFGVWTKMGVKSFESYSGAKEFIRRNVARRNVGNIVIEPTAVFLLRQAIELRLLGMFGIASVRYPNGRTVKAPGNFLFAIIKKNKNHINLPVKLSILKKIYEWSNMFVHTGREMWPWEVELAEFLLAPLFETETSEGVAATYGQTKISRELYDRMEIEVNEALVRETRKKCFLIEFWNRIRGHSNEQEHQTLLVGRFPARYAEASIVDLDDI
jgi:hypothetical protein